MKKNTWVFYFFIIVFTAILSINLVWRFTPVRSEISESVKQRLKSYMGESFGLDEFSVGIGYLSFKDISSGNEKENYQLLIEEIQVGYSIHKLFLNKFDPLKVIESITFKNPELLFYTERKNEDTSKQNSPDLAELISGFNRLVEIDRVLVENGKIYWGKNSDSTTKLVSNLDGYIVVKLNDRLTINLVGKLFESPSQDLSLNGDINISEQIIDINADVKKSQLKESIPFLNTSTFALKDAKVSGIARLVSTSFNAKDFNIQGIFDIEEMNALLFDQKLQAKNFELKFDGHHMYLPSVKGTAEDGEFNLKGNLGTIFHPEINLSIDLKNYSAQNLVISVPILELLNKGKLEGHVDISQQPSDIIIEGKLQSSELYYTFVPFRDNELEFVYNNKIWTFNKIYCYSAGMYHNGSGHIDFGLNKLFLDIYSHRIIGENIVPVFDRLNNTEMKYHTRINGDFSTLSFLGNINGKFLYNKEIILSSDANFELIDDRLTLQNYRSFPENVQILAKINQLWSDPTFQILEVKNLPIDSLTTLEPLDWLNKDFQADFYMSGPVNFPTAKVNFINRDNQEILFSFVGNAVNLIKKNLKFNANFSLQSRPTTIDGELFLESGEKFLNLNVNVSELGQAELKMEYGQDGPVSGNLKLQEILLKNYLGRFQEVAGMLDDGYVNGDITISGTTIQPMIEFSLHGHQFIINNNGYYALLLDGYYNATRLKFTQASLTYNNHPIIESDFDWDISSDYMITHFNGRDFESNFIAATIFKDSDLIQGKMNYDISLEGKLKNPRISGKVTMSEGVLKNRPFYLLNLSFNDSIPPGSSVFQIDKHIFKINEMNFRDKRGYSVAISGLMPVDEKGMMNLKIFADGNILAELPSLLSYFQDPESLGELYVHLSGSRDNPKIDAGNLLIYNGSINFESVIPPLTDLKAEIQLIPEKNFIKINYIEGKIDNHRARIYNLDSVKVGDQYLETWNFEEVGLDFGVLVIETDKKGIPLSIPGLMNPGDIGLFATAGKERNEAFYFYGPTDQPQVRGKLILSESRVTFPFLVDEDVQGEAEENVVVDFLWNVRWDVTVTSGASNRYFVDIPALIGEVYLDLNIDNVSDGLEFDGRLSDNSFRVGGGVESTRGRVEYLDMNFRVERFGIIFNKFELNPEVYGRAYTTVRDSTNFPRDIYLVLYTIDPETNREIPRGNWENFRFKLVSSDPTIGETQENVLSYMGYSVDNISSKAGDIGVTLTENLLIRPLVRPLERRMEKGLKLDYVRLSLQITSNLIYFGLQPRWKFLPEASYMRDSYIYTFDPSLLLLQSSEITVGKYVFNNFYLTYSGQLVSIYDEPKFGLNNRFGLEYRLLQNLLLEFEYDRFLFDPSYYNPERFQDFRIRLKHSFNF